jgi:ABC-type bacteriocin/lantibiotic exporter with double-glycine peptidase domain
MKSKHVDIITILVGVILSIIISIIWSTSRAQCLMHTSNVTLEQIENLPESFYIENVPFYDYTMVEGEFTQCMATSLAMVMRFYDNETTPDGLGNKFPMLGYSLNEFKDYATSKGFEIEDYESSIEDLKLKISEGKPVIVSQWYDSYHKWNIWGHVRVVVGYAKENGVEYFIAYDPVPEFGEDYKINFEEFKELWNREPTVCNRALLVYK